jgi:TPR repeat protein
VPALQSEARATERQTDGRGPGSSSSDETSASTTTAVSATLASLPVAPKDETVMLASRSKVETAPAPFRKLGPSDVELLMNKGQQFMAAGDVAAARVIFERAAEAGGAGAALAMGATYDPLVLKKIGALGVTADPHKARTWYEQAQDLGSPEALRRLELLANP